MLALNFFSRFYADPKMEKCYAVWRPLKGKLQPVYFSFGKTGNLMAKQGNIRVPQLSIVWSPPSPEELVWFVNIFRKLSTKTYIIPTNFLGVYRDTSIRIVIDDTLYDHNLTWPPIKDCFIVVFNDERVRLEFATCYQHKKEGRSLTKYIPSNFSVAEKQKEINRRAKLRDDEIDLLVHRLEMAMAPTPVVDEDPC
jgi:hypothetical protein